jgi:hypothetical protein
VPKTSSTSCDQAVFADQATGVSLPSDAVPVEIDRFPARPPGALLGEERAMLGATMKTAKGGHDGRTCPLA